MSQPSETPEEDSDFQDLEEKLAKLEPMAPSEAFTRRVSRRLDAAGSDRAEKRIVWARFGPVAAAACVVLTSAFFFKGYLIQKRVAENASSRISPAAGVAKEPVPSSGSTGEAFPTVREISPAGQFVPVSREDIFRSAEKGGIVGTRDDGVPFRIWRLEFDNTGHWYDPETDTNVRIVIPHDEFIRVPVPVD